MYQLASSVTEWGAPISYLYYKQDLKTSSPCGIRKIDNCLERFQRIDLCIRLRF